MNVWAYFTRHFPSPAIDHADEQTLRGMPLASGCGDDCKAAIDAAAKLRAPIRLAFGEASNDEMQLGQIVANVCCCYIAG